ncbi:MAG: hypothetical protein ABIH78_03480 [Candidatus Peregrinibacteria bacterium]
MAFDSSNKPSENVSRTRSSEAPRKKDNFKEIQEAGVGHEALSGVIGVDEGMETSGRVSEIITEAKKTVPAGGIPKTSTITDPAQIRAELLKQLPTSERAMRSVIAKEIKKEITYLHKKAMRMVRSPGNSSYFEMSNLMRKIRELKTILLSLFKAPAEKLKTLWLRFVHGVM